MNRDRLAKARRRQLHPTFERARTQPHEGDTIAVLRVHIGLHLEDETGDFAIVRRNLARFAWLRARWRREFGNRIDQLADTEILECGAEIDRGQVTVPIGLQIKFGIACLRQFDFFGDFGRQCRVCVNRAEKFAAVAFGAGYAAGGEIEYPFKGAAHAHGPAHRADIERKLVSNLVEYLETGAALAIDLVDESDDRHRPETADLEQLQRLRFDTLGSVNHHDRGIDRGQRAVSVFGKVLVTGRI